MISGWVQKVTEHRGTIQYLIKKQTLLECLFCFGNNNCQRLFQEYDCMKNWSNSNVSSFFLIKQSNKTFYALPWEIFHCSVQSQTVPSFRPVATSAASRTRRAFYDVTFVCRVWCAPNWWCRYRRHLKQLSLTMYRRTHTSRHYKHLARSQFGWARIFLRGGMGKVSSVTDATLLILISSSSAKAS